MPLKLVGSPESKYAIDSCEINDIHVLIERVGVTVYRNLKGRII